MSRKQLCKKNVGYLIAMRNNDVIIETDDDNYPK